MIVPAYLSAWSHAHDCDRIEWRSRHGEQLEDCENVPPRHSTTRSRPEPSQPLDDEKFSLRGSGLLVVGAQP